VLRALIGISNFGHPDHSHRFASSLSLDCALGKREYDGGGSLGRHGSKMTWGVT
jgi:hypothetical protein